jgi:hypothetical protein
VVPEQTRSGERGKDEREFLHDRPLQSETSHHVNTAMPFFIRNIARLRFSLAQACETAVGSGEAIEQLAPNPAGRWLQLAQLAHGAKGQGVNWRQLPARCESARKTSLGRLRGD